MALAFYQNGRKGQRRNVKMDARDWRYDIGALCLTAAPGMSESIF